MDDHRDRRLTEAADIRQAVDALLKVPSAHRAGFIHDRLTAAIDSAFAKHGSSTKAAFNSAQLLVIKDVCFSIVHVLDPKSAPKDGFIQLLLEEWKSKSPITKISSAFAALVVVFPIASSWWHFGKDHFPSWYAAAVGAANAVSEPVKLLPAASTPSTPGSPGTAAPPRLP